ncbi:hypothetical protein RFI_23178 [Reticulomyxa filosa]|uniref:Uncharacterized protein n=1 Tax=Reticulomyxa filosa TaxID=46433 RepID=X6MKL7_RETFI|nr:hypothetical protein RFI_23178 [Reticulomyxa filosa]|eukprot:ETO14191.1 hypothetical protein RFI_23178 [Reticulomyxa filosa]
MVSYYFKKTEIPVLKSVQLSVTSFNAHRKDIQSNPPHPLQVIQAKTLHKEQTERKKMLAMTYGIHAAFRQDMDEEEESQWDWKCFLDDTRLLITLIFYLILVFFYLYLSYGNNSNRRRYGKNPWLDQILVSDLIGTLLIAILLSTHKIYNNDILKKHGVFFNIKLFLACKSTISSNFNKKNLLLVSQGKIVLKTSSLEPFFVDAFFYLLGINSSKGWKVVFADTLWGYKLFRSEYFHCGTRYEDKDRTKSVKLQLWDVSTKDIFQHLLMKLCETAHGLIIVYDITNKESFDNVRLWLVQILHHVHTPVRLLLAGNKCDLSEKRVIEFQTAQAFADELNIPFVEISARSNINVDKAFFTIASQIDNMFRNFIAIFFAFMYTLYVTLF